MSEFNSHGGGFLYSSGGFQTQWDGATIPASDLTSNWVKVMKCDGGHISFHYKIDNTDWVGSIVIQASNDPACSNLSATAVELSSGTSSLSVPDTSDTNNSGVISLEKRAEYYRMFLDRTSGAATGNTITCEVHQ